MESSSQDEHPAQFPHGNQEALASMFSDLAVVRDSDVDITSLIICIMFPS